MESEERRTMSIPITGPLPSSPVTLPKKTLRASGRKRAPLHTSHASSPKKYFVPKPLHSGHAPYGELKEKRRGSISGNENPSYGHMNFADTMRDSPAASVILTSPSLSWSA